MRGLELTIEQREAAGTQAGDQPRQRHLRRVGRAADHAFPEERTAQREAVQTADQPLALPAFHGMGVASGVEVEEDALDRGADPRFRAIRGAFGAEAQGGLKIAVGGDVEIVSGNAAAERTR
ncbi:hypothetical protein ASG07_02970 [Sphingomonas sp. Leaf343]|nr:hypothetical protein ASG07_02970 [Sphingomonas sp. Leaf343]